MVSPYFARSPLTVAVFAAVVLVWVGFEVRQRLAGREGATSRDRGSYLLISVTVGAGWVCCVLAGKHLAPMPGEPLWFVLGVVLAAIGVALRVWCFRTLGRYFTVTVQTSADQQVVDRGPYRFVRHPSYTAILVTLLGFGLIYGTWPGVLALVAFSLAGLIGRIRVEERALLTDLGEPYARYAQGRKRLVPWVW